LTDFLGGADIAAGKLKETGYIHWWSPNLGATSDTGITALPGGSRYYDGIFRYIETEGHWWTSTEFEFLTTDAWRRIISYNYLNVFWSNSSRKSGFSVRCMKD
jgi:uncharacterized protein (TIGR02145 family)